MGKLRWFELIPVASFLALKGRCLHCKEYISISYPIVEILAGIVMIIVITEWGISWETVQMILLIYGVIAIAIIDWKHLIIPDEILIFMILVGFGYSLLINRYELSPAIYSGIFSFTAFIGIKILADRFFKKQTLGIGDIKLAGVLGFILGWKVFLIVVWTASIVGSLYGITQLLFFNKSRDTKLPFGTFLGIVSFGAIVFKYDIEQYLIEWITHS